MRKYNLLSACLLALMFTGINAQTEFPEGENVVVYSLPKTELCIEVQLEKVVQKPGPFYRYSERFLATNKVITEEKTVYSIKNIAVTQLAKPDASRTFAILPAENPAAARIAVDAKGILCGVNIRCACNNLTNVAPTSVDASVVPSPALLPLGEEYMMAGSEAKLAEGAAKQIYRIRESRLSLLTADLEKLPADGASTKLMLDGMNASEKNLTELFIGQRSVETVSHKIFLTPSTPMAKEVLFRMSALKGLVASDDLSGTPYYINIAPEALAATVQEAKPKKEKTGLFSLVPAATNVSIGDGTSTFFAQQYYMPQFGKMVALPENLMKQPNVKIHIDSQTGRVLSIE